MAEDEDVDRKDASTRRVYNLPPDLLVRLRAFQVKQGIASEAEAARRLLDMALQMKDSAADILNSLQSKYVEERDLRVLASEVLTKHILVINILFSENSVSFKLANGERGQILSNGDLLYGEPDQDENEYNTFRRASKIAAKTASGASWDAGRGGGDLDDEIPF